MTYIEDNSDLPPSYSPVIRLPSYGASIYCLLLFYISYRYNWYIYFIGKISFLCSDLIINLSRIEKIFFVWHVYQLFSNFTQWSLPNSSPKVVCVSQTYLHTNHFWSKPHLSTILVLMKSSCHLLFISPIINFANTTLWITIHFPHLLVYLYPIFAELIIFPA